MKRRQKTTPDPSLPKANLTLTFPAAVVSEPGPTRRMLQWTPGSCTTRRDTIIHADIQCDTLFDTFLA